MAYFKLGGALIMTLGLAITTTAGTQREERTFDSISTINIGTVSGDCVIQKGTGEQVKVEVIWSYRPADSFEPRFSDRGGTLKLSEEIFESNSGNSTWTLTVPDGVRIRFNSASGGLEVAGLEIEIRGETASGDYRIDLCRGDFQLSSASGNIDLTSCNGEFDVSTASGDIRMIDCDGQFDLSSASGDVESDGMSLAGPSSFSAASGSVAVSLARAIEYDLSLSTASGDAELNLGGNQVQGYFEFSCRYREGRIEAPFDFEGQQQFRQHGDRYMRKWFSRGGDKPEIMLETASGTVILAER